MRANRLPRRSQASILSLIILLISHLSPWTVLIPGVNAADTVVPVPSVTTGPAGSTSNHQPSVINNQHVASTNLDLSSVAATIPSNNTKPVNILVGGTASHGTITGAAQLSVSPGQLLTPAQFAAVSGMTHGQQALLLSSLGSAVGGSLSLNSSNLANLTSIVVPKGVTINAVGFNSQHPLNVSGNVEILGSLYALQPVPNVSSVLNMANLTIGAGGLLSAHLPAGMLLPDLFASAGLILNVSGNVQNQGVINTPGTLNINAAGSIINQSVANSQAIISAQNINLLTGSGVLLNSGLMQADSTLNLNTNSSTDLIVNNTGGVLQAVGAIVLSGIIANGVINIRDVENIETANAGVWGGTLDAPGGINMYGKNMVLAVDHINGELSNTGSTAHVSVNSGNLVLGRQSLSGDPTYYNKSGDIQIADLTTVGGDLAIVASGSILVAGKTFIQTTAANNSIFLGAGLNFTATPADGSVGSFSANDPGDFANTLNFDGSSNPGKDIGSAGNQLNLTTTGAGTITLYASGSINTGGGTITSGGDVLINCGVNYDGSGGTIVTNTGNVTITSTTPSGFNGSITNGTLSSPFSPGFTSASGNLTLPAINVGGTVTVSTNGTISASAIDSTGAISIGSSLPGGTKGITLTGDVSNGGATGGVSINTDTGGINGGTSSVTSPGIIVIQENSSGNIIFTGGIISSSGGDISVFTSGTGNVQVATVDNLFLGATVSLGSKGNGTTTTGNISCNEGIVSIGNNAVGGGTGVTLNGLTKGFDIRVLTRSGSITGTAAADIIADGPVNILAQGGSVSLAGLVDNTAGILTVTVNATNNNPITVAGISSNQGITIGNTTDTAGITLNGNLNGGSILLLTKTGFINGGSFDLAAVGALSLDVAGSGPIVCTGNLSSTSTIDVSTSGGSNITLGNLTCTGANSPVTISVHGGGTIATGNITANGGLITIGSLLATGITLNGAINNTKGGTGAGISVLTSNTLSGNAFASISSDGTITLTSTGALTLLDAVDNSSASSAKSLTIDSLNDVTTVHAVSSKGAIRIGNIVNFGTGVDLLGNVTNATGSGDIDILAVTSHAGGDSISGNADLTSAGNLTIRTQNGGNITFGNGTLHSLGGAVLIETITGPGNIDISSPVLDSLPDGPITVKSITGTVDVGQIVCTGGLVTIGNQGVGQTVNINATIDNTNKGVGQGIKLFTGNGGINSAKSTGVISDGTIQVLAKGGAVSLDGFLDNSSGSQSIFVESENNTVTVGDISTHHNVTIGNLTSTSGVTLNGLVTNASGVVGNISILSSSGSINASNAAFAADARSVLSIRLQAGAGNINITAGTLSAAGGNIDVQTLGTGNVQVFGVNDTFAGGSVTLNAPSGTVTAGSVTAKGGLVTIGNNTLCSGVSLNGPINNTNAGAGNGVSILAASGNITGSAAASISTDKSVNILATGGNVSLGAAIDNSTGSSPVIVNSTDDTVTVDAVASKGNITIGDFTGTAGITLNGDVITTGTGNILIQSNTGGITGSKNVTSAGSLQIKGNVSGDISLAGGTLSAGNGELRVQTAKTSSGTVQVGTVINTTANSKGGVSLGGRTTTVGDIITAVGKVSIGLSPTDGDISLLGPINSGSGVAVKSATGSVTGSVLASMTASGSVKVTAINGITLSALIDNSSAPGTAVGLSSAGAISAFNITSKGAVTIGDTVKAAGITLTGPVTNAGGTGKVSIATKTGGINGGANNVTSAGSLSINAVSGNVIFTGGTLSAAGGSLTVQAQGNANSVQVASVSNTFDKAAVTLKSTTGTTTVGTITANGGLITIGNSKTGSAVTLNGPIDNTNLLGLGAGIKILCQNGGISSALPATISSDGPITITAANGPIALSAAIDNSTANSVASTVTVDAKTDTLSISDVTSNQNITIGDSKGATAVSSTGTVSGLETLQILSKSGNISLTGPIAASKALTLSTLDPFHSITATQTIFTGGPLLIKTSVFNSSSAVQGSPLTIGGPALASLTVNNSGTLQANTGNISISSAAGFDLVISGGGQMTASSGLISLKAPAKGTAPSKIDFTGSQTFNTNASLNATGIGQSIVIEDTVTVFNPNNPVVVRFNTNNFILNGSGTTSGWGPGAFVFSAAGGGAGTIQNPSGSIDLKNVSLQFQGKALTILAQGDIVNTGAASTIKLSAPSAATYGGQLILIAGYVFASGGASTSPVGGSFTVTGDTGTPAKISLANVSVNTSSTGPSTGAGNVLAVATGPITLGAINASSTGTNSHGGSVVVIGNGVTLGAINTSADNGGLVSISSAVPKINNSTITINNGILTGAGFFTPDPAKIAGNIAINAITAGSGDVSIATGGSGAITQAAGTISSTGLLSVTNGSKGFALRTAASTLELNTSANLAANVSITSSVLALLQDSTIGGNLSVTSTAGVSVADEQTVLCGGNLNLTSSATSTAVRLGNGSSLTAGNAGPGNISISSTATNGMVLGERVVLTANAGDIVLKSTSTNAAAAISIGDGLQMQANGGSISITGSQVLNIGTVGAGGNILTASSTGSKGGAISLTAPIGISLSDSTSLNSSTTLSLTASNATVGSGVLIGINNIMNSGGTATISGAKGISIGDNFTLNSPNATVTLTQAGAAGPAAGISIGDNSSFTAGSLVTAGINAAPPSPAPLLSENILKPGAITITAAGVAGLSLGINSQLTSNGASVTLHSTKAAANTSVGDGAVIQANGGSISITSAAQATIGALEGAANSMVARKLDAGAGAISIIGNTGVLVGDSTSDNANTTLLLTSSLGSITIGAGNITAGSSTVISGKSGITITGLVLASGNNSLGLKLASSNGFISIDSSDLASGSLLTLSAPSSVGAITVDNASLLSAASALSITGAGAITIGALDGNPSTLSASTSLSIKSTGANALVLLGANSLINPASSIAIYSDAAGGTVQALTPALDAQTTLAISGKDGVTIGDAVTLSTVTGGLSLTASDATAGLGVVIGALNGGVTIDSGAATTIKGANGISIANNFTLNSKTALTLTQSGLASGVAIGDAASITAGVVSISSTNGFANIGSIGGSGVSITATGSNAGLNISGKTSLLIGTGSVLNATGALKLTSASTTIGDASQLSTTDKLTVTATGNLTAGNSVQLSGSSVAASSAGDILSFGSGAQITATAATAGNITLTMSKSTLTPTLTVGDNFNITTVNGSIMITGKSGGLNLGIPAGNTASLLKANGTMGNVSLTASGNVALGVGTVDSFKTLTISSTTGTVQTTGSKVGASNLPTTITITGQSGVNIANGSQIVSFGNLIVTAKGTSNLTIGDSVSLTAGKLFFAAPTNPFVPAFVQGKGSIILTGANQVSIGDNNIWTSNGGNINVTAKTSTMQIGNAGINNQFFAYGGNIVMLAKGVVTGAANNHFQAIGMGTATPVANTGGGIEIGSGLTTSGNLSLAFAKHPAITPPPAPLGNPTILNTNGVIQVNNKSGNANAINLTGSTLTLTGTTPAGAKGGVQVFDAATSGSAVNMQNATFVTKGFKPIAMTSIEAVIEENNNAALPVQLKSTDNGSTAVAVGNYHAELQLYELADGGTGLAAIEQATLQAKNGKTGAKIFARAQTHLLHTRSAALYLSSGEVFVNASAFVDLKTDLAEVHTSKGALASIRHFQGNTYVKVCSGLGTVSVSVSGKKIAINPGEELLITDHKPDASEIHPEDGLGRRNSQTKSVGKNYVTISDFSIITMLSGSDLLSGLVQSKLAQDKQLIARLLKTAATVDLIFRHRGAYTSLLPTKLN